jgi:uncharacterized protein YndB with AHSA1/START domain
MVDRTSTVSTPLDEAWCEANNKYSTRASRCSRRFAKRSSIGARWSAAAASGAVMTSQLTGGWRPAASWMPMTAVFSMQAESEGTRYIARCMHPDAATRDKHEAMGFFEGWGICIDQLDALACTLA